MEGIMQLLKQYRYGVLVLLIGLGLMLIPSESEKGSVSEVVTEVKTADLEEDLEDILSQIHGAGKARVLLTEATGETRVYQQDSNQSGENRKQETVVITHGDRSQEGLVSQIIPARYQGAVVVCQGGDSASVRLAIVEAVASVTGLTSDKITVLKMK